MKELKARLTQVIQRTATVKSFRFVFPEKIKFLPGQFLQLIFDPDNRQNKELNKYLSLSCSPTRDYIEVTKRLSESVFSQRLESLKINDEVLVKIPLGDCVFKDEYKNIGFLIGGIGITPVISILEYIHDKKLGTDTYLFYSNRTEEDIAFRKELDDWQAADKNIKVFYTVTQCEPVSKSCIFGFIDQKLLQEKACDLNERIVYIFGPPGMVDTMCNLSLALSCKKENIKTEKFVGY